MVCIFFLLSGYVLTIPRAANLEIASGYWGELIIRRYFRPTPIAFVSVMLLYTLWVSIGIPNESMTDYGPGFAYMEKEYTFTPSLYEAAYNGIIGVYTFHRIQYNPVLWSIGIELLGGNTTFLYVCIISQTQKFYYVILYSFNYDSFLITKDLLTI